MEEVYSYIKEVWKDGKRISAIPVRLEDPIAIPANAQLLPYDKEIVMPDGKYDMFHAPDCRYYAVPRD